MDADDCAALFATPPDAFDSGGAQLTGGQRTNETDLSDDLDISIGKHAMRAGVLIESALLSTDVRRNAAGTFTFSSLDAYNAGLPTTFPATVTPGTGG